MTMIDAVTADYVVSGDRVTMRPFAPSDITARYVGWLNDAHLMRFSNQRFVHHDERSCRAYLESFAGTPNLFAAIAGRQSFTRPLCASQPSSTFAAPAS